MKILVAIPNHGTKNRRFLDRLLTSFRAMRHDVTVVVNSDQPKPDLPPEVEVRVGTPTANPRSLTFAHRRLFVDRANDFDLFIYCEDDTLLEERHIDAFLEVNALLPANEIAGFMRFELRPSGERSYCSVHSHFRWDPGSVRMAGGLLFASFTNPHSACFMLTKAQLRAAIDSGGFMVAPHDGLYGMLEAAATDPYLNCGFERRIAISRIDDFLLHHLPNIYLDKLGVKPEEFKVQLEALVAIAEGRVSSKALVKPSSKLRFGPWALPCYPRATAALNEVLAPNVRSALSVGTTAGILERELFGDAAVVAIPVDNVFGGLAATRGIEVTEPDWTKAMEHIQGRHFDAVLLHDVLHRFPDPGRVLRDLRERVGCDAQFIITMPNYWHYRFKAAARRQKASFPQSFETSDLHRPTWSALDRWLHDGGLKADRKIGRSTGRIASKAQQLPFLGRTWFAEEIIVSARAA